MDVQAMHCQGPEQRSRRLPKSRAGSNTVIGGGHRRVTRTVHPREHTWLWLSCNHESRCSSADELANVNRHPRERQVTTTARIGSTDSAGTSLSESDRRRLQRTSRIGRGPSPIGWHRRAHRPPIRAHSHGTDPLRSRLRQITRTSSERRTPTPNACRLATASSVERHFGVLISDGRASRRPARDANSGERRATVRCGWRCGEAVYIPDATVSRSHSSFSLVASSHRARPNHSRGTPTLRRRNPRLPRVLRGGSTTIRVGNRPAPRRSRRRRSTHRDRPTIAGPPVGAGCWRRPARLQTRVRSLGRRSSASSGCPRRRSPLLTWEDAVSLRTRSRSPVL